MCTEVVLLIDFMLQIYYLFITYLLLIFITYLCLILELKFLITYLPASKRHFMT